MKPPQAWLGRARLAALLAALLPCVAPAPAPAGTTGGLRGRVLDEATGAAIAHARVDAVAPSQNATAETDSSGAFSFIALAPDTYLVSVERPGYEPQTASGVTVLADQVQTLATFTLRKPLRTVAHVRARSPSDLVRSGTTSDVYSIDAAGQAAAQTAGGPGGLNQAYSAIAAVPGVNLPQGQQGWYQLAYIRGGDYSDVANELDGIPVQRASDFAPTTMLSNLGQQEVQVYTGGTPPSAEASGLSGFVNQVIKTGTYPGYRDASLGIGAPTFYHKLTVEAGGVVGNNTMSYYVGLSGADQGYRYADQFNGGGPSQFFAPLNVATGLNGTVFDGSGPAYFSAGPSYAIAHTQDRETVVNLRFKLGDGAARLPDHLQVLFVTSEIYGQFYSSLNDLGGPAYVAQAFGAPATFVDENVYNGALFAPPEAGKIGVAFSPSTPAHAAFDGPIPPNLRDADDHGVSILKLQYEKNFSSSSLLRVFGYSEYNNWFLNGPVSAFLTYGGELQDYEVHGNTFGATAMYLNQLSFKHLFTATASYQTQRLETISNDTFGVITTNLVDPRGNCYSPATGFYASCFVPIYSAAGLNPLGGLNQYGQYGAALPGYPTESLVPALTPPPGTPAANNGARWLVTEDGREAQVDRITPYFSAFSLADEWHPNDRLTLNAGLRVENYDYRLDDTAGGFPAREFWFGAYDREFCFGAGATAVQHAGVDPATGSSLCPAGTNANLVNASPPTIAFTAYQPRLSFSYAAGRDTVVRGSYGRYAAPAPTSYQQFDVVQQNLPSFIGQFLPYGFNEPFHQSRPSYSSNFDLSLEQRFGGSDVSLKLTPFYRSTQDQLANFPIGAQGILDGLNVGRQRNYGFEFEIRKGSFDRDGVAAQLSYTYTRSRVRYSDFGTGGRNEIDNLNDYIRAFNAYTSACTKTSNAALCGATSNGVPAAACYTTGGLPDPSCAAGGVANPYFASAPQPLMDRNGEFVPYDILPVPFYGANSYETPHVATLLLNYKRGRFALTPTFTYSSGASYGSPLVWPGYDPLSCTGTLAGSNQADPKTCSNYLFIPDAYTGRFDSFGTLREPARLTANLQLGYAVSRHLTLKLAMTGLGDWCFQRGYAWDNPSTCVYSQLASNKLAPAGNFVSNPPPQLAYPYGSWYNNEETGFVGQRLPFSAFLTLDVRL